MLGSSIKDRNLDLRELRPTTIPALNDFKIFKADNLFDFFVQETQKTMYKAEQLHNTPTSLTIQRRKQIAEVLTKIQAVSFIEEPKSLYVTDTYLSMLFSLY